MCKSSVNEWNENNNQKLKVFNVQSNTNVYYPPFYGDGIESLVITCENITLTNMNLSQITGQICKEVSTSLVPFELLGYQEHEAPRFIGRTMLYLMNPLESSAFKEYIDVIDTQVGTLSTSTKADADSSTGNLWVEASAIADRINYHQSAHIGAYIDGVSLENRYFSVLDDGTYKFTFNIVLIDGFAKIICYLGNVQAKGKCNVKGEIYKQGSETAIRSEILHTFYDKIDTGLTPYEHNFNNDPTHYSGTIIIDLQKNQIYSFRCILRTEHDATTYFVGQQTSLNPISMGRMNINLASVMVERL